MNQAVSADVIAQLFTTARTHHVWANKPLPDSTLEQIYDLAKWGPTAMNANPMRILFVKSDAGKEKLYPALMGSNVEQVRAAPAVAIICQDTEFYNHLPTLFPAFDARPMFQNDKAMSESTAFRNSTLQGAYFMIAARSLGLDVGPMSGFDSKKVDETFFKDSSWRSNFLCNLGYGDHEKLYPRGPRLDFKTATKTV